jgi:hypothetical protein
MFCPSFGWEIFIRSAGLTDLTRVETFPGAACLTMFAVMQRAEANYRGVFLVRSKRLARRSL